MTAHAEPDRSPASAAPPGPHRWLLFVHQLPASPSNLRVRTWRRLQQIGAIPIKQAVYALPDSPTAREDMEWLTAEVKAAGGDASVFAASHVDRWSDDALVDEFRRSRQDAYLALAEEIERLLPRLDAKRRRRGTRRPALGRLIEGLRTRLAALERVDFFGSAGRDRVVSLLAALDDRTRAAREALPPPGSGPIDRAAYAGRSWVTRPRPGVDRMSSAWLIRRFIDRDARFGFAPDRDALPSPDALPFDMFGVEFSHQGDGCTFETLCQRFGIDDPAIRRIAAIVHDLDLKDGRFGVPEAGAVGTLIDGLQLATTNDDVLLERGMTLFESLYLAFADAARLKGPRPVSPASAPAPPRSKSVARRKRGR
jgi:hypothetical protein